MISDPSQLIKKGCGGVLINVDDGHVPENLPRDTPTKLVDYPWLFAEKEAGVHIFHNAIPESLVDAAYHKTIKEPQSSWGDYVTLTEIQKCWDSDDGNVDDLVTNLAAQYLRLTMDSNPSIRLTKNGKATKQQDLCPVLWKAEDLPAIHGVGVWALESTKGAQVPYHLDYAEQIRYASNLIVPPLLAGTLQCTKDRLIGGDFLISLQGIPHYLRHGYKATVDDGEMISIPYQYNQLSCHYGNLPHASAKIQKIEGTQRRVIVGFNVFGHDFGALVQKAPEHSDAFRRMVQVQRAFAKKKMSLEAVKQNKALTKLLVLAKRERIKQEFQEARQRISEDLPNRLPATVQDLMEFYYNNDKDSCWPSSEVDVQVFLHHQIYEGNFQVVNVENLPQGTAHKDLVSPMALIDLAPFSSDTSSSAKA